MFNIVTMALAAVAFAVAVMLLAAPPPREAPPAPEGWARTAGVVRVIDGDTLDLGGARVRLHGVDAPESNQSCLSSAGEVWACGAWVTGEVRALLEGRRAACERRDTDRYGRAVARCGLEGAEARAVAEAPLGAIPAARVVSARLDAPAPDALAQAKAEGGVAAWGENGLDIGAEIVARGLAVAYSRYARDYEAVEAVARAQGLGVFEGTMAAPWDHRSGAAVPLEAQASEPDGIPVPDEALAFEIPPDPDCAIKGNTSSNGRIYHVPGGQFYDRTIIDAAKGQRWFCSQEDAEAAGWRASRR